MHAIRPVAKSPDGAIFSNYLNDKHQFLFIKPYLLLEEKIAGYGVGLEEV